MTSAGAAQAARSRDPRRTRRAVLLAGLTFAASFIALGFALAAGGDTPGLPATFGVAPARHGDRGVYTVTWDPRPNETSVATEIAFEEVGDGSITAADGRTRATHDRQEITRSDDTPDGGTAPTTADHTYHLGRQAHDVLARTTQQVRIGTSAQSTVTGIPGGIDITDTEQRGEAVRRTEYAPTTAPLCGHRSGLQGQAHDLDRPVRVHGSCGGVVGVHQFIPLGVERWSGRSTLVIGLAAAPDTVQLWMHPDFAHPLRVLERSPDHTRVLTLARYEAGTLPLVAADAPIDPTPATPLPLVPRGTLGPDATGLPVAWPLASAYGAARDHPEYAAVREFLARHPGAVVVSAHSWHESRDHTGRNETRDVWRFTLSPGGDIALTTRVDRLRTHADEGAPLGLPTVAGPGDTIEASESTGPSGPFPGRNALTPSMVSPASLWARWDAMDTDPVAPTVYGFYLHCSDAACTTSRGTVTVGRDHRHEEVPPASAGFAVASAPLRSARLLHASAVGLDAHEHVTPVSVDRFAVDPLFEAGTPTPESATEPAPLSARDDTTWAFPTARVSLLVTIVSLLVGLAYRLWPLVKGLSLLSLFSRDPDQLLAHPVRAGIMDLVTTTPGIHYNELQRRVGHGNHVVRHHLDRLLAARLVVETQGPRFACYFPRGAVDRRVMDVLPVVKAGAAEAVLRAVLRVPGRSAGAIAAEVGLAPGSITYHVRRLVDAGLVEQERDGRSVRLTPTALAAPTLAVLARAPAAA